MPKYLGAYPSMETGFDPEMEEAIRRENEVEFRRFANLVHRALVQNEDGAKLLAELYERVSNVDMGYGLSNEHLRHIAGKRELVLELMNAAKLAESGD